MVHHVSVVDESIAEQEVDQEKCPAEDLSNTSRLRPRTFMRRLLQLLDQET